MFAVHVDFNSCSVGCTGYVVPGPGAISLCSLYSCCIISAGECIGCPEINNPAVVRLRDQARQQELEDAERFRLKDHVDQKIMQWKGGKETNLRALISSLDVVLWDGIGWKTIGLHELVTSSQVKIRYIKAIAKVHPDKVNILILLFFLDLIFYKDCTNMNLFLLVKFSNHNRTKIVSKWYIFCTK